MMVALILLTPYFAASQSIQRTKSRSIRYG